MLKRVNTDEKIQRCKDCAFFESCKSGRPSDDGACFREMLRARFEELYNGDTGECDDI